MEIIRNAYNKTTSELHELVIGEMFEQIHELGYLYIKLKNTKTGYIDCFDIKRKAVRNLPYRNLCYKATNIVLNYDIEINAGE